MSVKTIAFFNNKGGVGKTSLVYHLSVMFTELGLRVVVADLDPQANLTTAFLDEEQLEELWQDNSNPDTIFKCINPLMGGTGDVAEPCLIHLFESQLALLSGDLKLSLFEDDLSQEWPKCSDGKERAFRVISAFYRVIQKAAFNHAADLVFIDIGPNLGAINRAALIAADFVVVPLSPDLFSLQGMKNLGPTLRTWRTEWQTRKQKNPLRDLRIPQGSMAPLGYIVVQHSECLNRPVKAYNKWIRRIPIVYRNAILDEYSDEYSIESIEADNISQDPNCLALLKHYRSLMPMAQEAKKPMFFLKPADGAIGAHIKAVQEAYKNFKCLSNRILTSMGITPHDDSDQQQAG